MARPACVELGHADSRDEQSFLHSDLGRDIVDLTVSTLFKVSESSFCNIFSF
jgi:hypothetical protein